MDYAPLMFKIQRLSENTLVTITIYKLYLHTKFKEEIFSCKGGYWGNLHGENAVQYFFIL